MDPLKIPISSTQAMDLVVKGDPLTNYIINGVFDLYKIKDEIKSDLIINNCVVESLDCPTVKFKNPVRWINSHFINTSCHAVYFTQGIIIDNCIFDSYLDFEAGGHNKKLVIITNTEFKGFVNFFDCWYQDEVIITGNNFRKGTNLLGNRGESFQTQFDISPIIENNIGRIDYDHQGDRDANTIWLWTPPDKPPLE